MRHFVITSPNYAVGYSEDYRRLFNSSYAEGYSESWEEKAIKSKQLFELVRKLALGVDFDDAG